ALRCLLNYGKKIDIGGGLFIDLGRVSLLNEFGRQSVLDYYEATCKTGAGLSVKWEDQLSSAINGQADLQNRNPFALLDDCAGLKGKASLSQIWKELLAIYAKENLVDFDVIMVLFEYLLRTDPVFLKQSRGSITHIIVDEFQDTNYPQLSSVASLAGYSPNVSIVKARQVMVVGDDFQIIYDWRGAVSGIFEIFASWGACITLPLHQSFRSSAPVLRLVNNTSNKLAAHPQHIGLCKQVPAKLVAARW
ncbi:MAG: ATP-dependent helicase, partial [Deltaproteobacteria bacterium]|nr:ATP-dependent helicase [Deltaproteobacteria bacterium]